MRVPKRATSTDEVFMRRALRLAARARGRTSPNPMVGAVIVNQGRIVAEGWHRGAGKPHAEVLALQSAGQEAHGATLYVTLEPCCHWGRTPPCVDAVIAAGIRKVVAGVVDPDQRVSGNGGEKLRAAGIEVEFGLLEQEASRLIEAHRKYVTTRRPFVTVKLACSLDGKIATASGQSQWITGEKARRFAHRLRAESDAVMVGAGTVLADDPLLTARLVRSKRQPLRIVVDGAASIPSDARVLQAASSPAMVVVGASASERAEGLRASGAEVLCLPDVQGRIDLGCVLDELGRREITTLLVEGGARLVASLVEERLVDKFIFILAPMLIGGTNSPGAIAGAGAHSLEDAIRLRNVSVRRLGEDIVVEGYPSHR
jgi:diaminohydroxyphosphoribosylaminopyrimidine deaminase/5-amino-6-(5-phosphoribosylamino)uracil reductase